MNISESIKFPSERNGEIDSLLWDSDSLNISGFETRPSKEEVQEFVEVRRLGCKVCLRNTPAVENLKKVSLVTIKEEESDPDVSLNCNEESFSLWITRVIPSGELLAFKKAEFLLKWNFLNYTDSLTFHSNYSLNYQRDYNFAITEFKYSYLSECPLPIEFYVTLKEHEQPVLIGKVDIYLKQGLEHVGRIYENRLKINNKDLALCYKNVAEKQFGYLVCSYIFKGSLGRYTSCIPKPTETFSLESIPSLAKSLESFASLPSVKSAELKAFQDGLNMVLIRNKALRTKQEDIISELNERTTWMHEELKWRLTLQEHAIMRGEDPNLVKWRQWKDEFTSNVKYRSNANEEFNRVQVAFFEINIVELQLNPFSRIALDDKITHLYIEYSFLHISGQQLETVSKLKPLDDRPIRFDFVKNFEIRKTDKEAKQLADMIRNDEMITFTAISEPIPDPNSCQSCVEVGHCQVGIFDLVQSSTDTLVDCYPVYDELDGERELGKLKIIFGGLLSLRSIALRIMTPESFNIIR